MSSSATHRAIDAVWRIESARLIAGLTRIVRDVAAAEDLAQDAFLAALQQWPASGIPDKPGAWLMATAGERWIRPTLCADALRLARILVALMPRESEVHGLLALMELQASRLRARVGPHGEPILLADQSRARWDHLLVQRGLAGRWEAYAETSSSVWDGSLRRASSSGGRPSSVRTSPSASCCSPALSHVKHAHRREPICGRGPVGAALSHLSIWLTAPRPIAEDAARWPERHA